MASYADMRDAYNSIYEGCGTTHKKSKKKAQVTEALDILLDSGIIDEETYIELMEREVKKNPYPSPRRQHTPPTKDEWERRKEGWKKLADRKYFDSPRD